MRTTRFLLAASIALAMALTFSACSDDKDDPASSKDDPEPSKDDPAPSYGTCKQLMNSVEACYEQINADVALQVTLLVCVNTAGVDPVATEACYAPIEDAMGACIMATGICGGASISACEEHFDKECEDED